MSEKMEAFEEALRELTAAYSVIGLDRKSHRRQLAARAAIVALYREALSDARPKHQRVKVSLGGAHHCSAHRCDVPAVWRSYLVGYEGHAPLRNMYHCDNHAAGIPDAAPAPHTGKEASNG